MLTILSPFHCNRRSWPRHPPPWLEHPTPSHKRQHKQLERGGGGRRQKGKGGWVKSREGEGGTEERGRKEDIVEGHRRQRMTGRECGGEKGARRWCKMLRGEAACQPHLGWFVRLWKWPMRLEEHEEAQPPCSLAAWSSHQGG